MMSARRLFGIAMSAATWSQTIRPSPEILLARSEARKRLRELAHEAVEATFNILDLEDAEEPAHDAMATVKAELSDVALRRFRVVAEALRAEELLWKEWGRSDPHVLNRKYEPPPQVIPAPTHSGGTDWYCEPVGGDVIERICIDANFPCHQKIVYTDGTSADISTVPPEEYDLCIPLEAP